MKKQILAVVCSLTLLLAAGACRKKEEKPPVPQAGMPGQEQGFPQVQQPAMPGQQPAMPGQQQGVPQGQMNIVVPKAQKTIVVPDSVKGKWKGVILVVSDKKANKQHEYTINLNSDLKIPNSNLKVSVGEYLPDFRMDGLNITSASNEPNNPAVGVKVFEHDEEIFKGWLYSKFPTMHPFEHPNYSIVLKGGVKKG
ncbi:MAG: DUF2155 domain-containing protein [Nitrospira bacterium HGW-Nitrospira-1]|nr:MAG: DUF2155 domain-containing protein [Nitrospira bacterium HGW-Nitrospira-1]